MNVFPTHVGSLFTALGMILAEVKSLEMIL